MQKVAILGESGSNAPRLWSIRLPLCPCPGIQAGTSGNVLRHNSFTNMPNACVCRTINNEATIEHRNHPRHHHDVTVKLPPFFWIWNLRPNFQAAWIFKNQLEIIYEDDKSSTKGPQKGKFSDSGYFWLKWYSNITPIVTLSIMRRDVIKRSWALNIDFQLIVEWIWQAALMEQS